MGVITNHNHFDIDEFKCLRKRAIKEGILLLPGLELGIKEGGGGIHTLIVFDPEDWLPARENTDYISRFLNGQFTSTPDEGSRTKGDLCGVLRSLDDFGFDYFVIFAHCQTDNGFFSELDGGAIPPLIEHCGKHWRDRVLGFQKVKNRKGIDRIWPKEVPFPASVDGSDPRTFEEVARQNDPFFLKIGELSFDAVKFALHDHGQRVLTGSKPSAASAPFLSEIRFEEGRLAGQVYPLNEQLSCLIGSRGSGKSSVIEALRFALGIDSGSDDARYKNGLVETVLENGGEVIVSLTKSKLPLVNPILPLFYFFLPLAIFRVEKGMKLPTREEIKIWLKTATEGREWLAEECGVAKTTIDKWLSKKEIPIAQHYKIAGLMNPPESVLEQETSMIRIPFDDELLELAHKAAGIVSAEFQDFCSRAIRHRAREIIRNHGKPSNIIDPAGDEIKDGRNGGEINTAS